MQLPDHVTILALADEIQRAAASGQPIATLPTSRPGGLDLDAAYAIERELARRRHEEGPRSIGRKVGYANKALWRAFKLETLVWADMYNDTVMFAAEGGAELAMASSGPRRGIFSLRTPKIEPEIVFKLREAPPSGVSNPAEVLACIEWLALGFEIIDCVWIDWKYQPADFVAAYGLHAGLVIGQPRPVQPETRDTLADALPSFTVTLACNGEVVETGSGRNSLRSPALCVAELAAAVGRRSDATPLASGELVSSGALTDSRPILAGQTWTAAVAGLDLAPLTLRVIP